MKYCPKCQVSKPIESFAKQRSRKDGHTCWCRDCYRAYRINNAEKLKAYDKIRGKERRDAARLAVMHHYGAKCSCCGEERAEFLSVDHINGGGKAHRLIIGNGGGRIHKWLIQNNFPDGFRILCHNCNMSRGIYGYCPHEVDPLTIGYQLRYSHHQIEQEAIDAQDQDPV